MHLLALLAGIYLMIFVVEPVAVPHHYLSQYYYGLPWSSDVRLHRDYYANLPFLERKSFLADTPVADRRKTWIPNDNQKTLQPGAFFQQHRIPGNKIKGTTRGPLIKSPVVNRKNTTQRLSSKVRYISSQHLQVRRNSTSASGNVQHWSKWIPPRNSTDKPSLKDIDTLYWRPSVRTNQRSKPSDTEEKKVLNTAGSITSIRLTEANA